MNSKHGWIFVALASAASMAGCTSGDGDDGNTSGAGGAAGVAGAAGGAGTTAGTGGMAGAAGMNTGGAGMAGAGTGGMAGGAGSAGAAGAMGTAGSAGAGGAAGAAGSAGMAGMGGMGGGEFTLTNPDFEDGEMLPAEHRCVALAGDTGPSPALMWTGAPAEAMSFAVTLTDTTAGGSMGYAHWTIYDIPSSVTSLPEGVPEGAMPAMPAGAKQAPNQNMFVGGPGYFGPCGGMNTYEFKLYALDVATLPGVTGTSTAMQVRAALDMHDIATATLGVMSAP